MRRREVLRLAAGALALWACDDTTAPVANYPEARLRARPREPIWPLPAGVHPLELNQGRDGLIVIPTGQAPASGWPLAVLLHGSGGDARYWAHVHGFAQQLGIVLLLPESRYGSWDARDYAADSEFIDRALLKTFGRCAIDGRRMAIGGFSAGASYALTLGLANGDLFSDVFAFAPSRLQILQRHGRPEFFIAHGTQDQAVAAAVSRDEVVPGLRARGYRVDYEEFEGGHTVPLEVAQRALQRI